MKAYKVLKKSENLKSEIVLPASKSISNRLLVMRALEKALVHFDNLSESDDTYMMRLYLSFITTCSDSKIPMVIDAHNAGTVFRFLTAYLAQKPGKWLVTGSERMRQRPVADLVDALRSLGAEINYTEKEGYPPLMIFGKKFSGEEVEINASSSSQFVSAMMMIAPHFSNGLKIKLTGKAVSTSYIDMTMRLMKDFLVEVERKDNEIHVHHGHYFVRKLTVESDWSSAAFWYQMVAFLPNAQITLPGLQDNSTQGDRFLVEVFEKLGVKTEFTETGVVLTRSGKVSPEISFDFSDAPDIVPSVMTACAVLGVKGFFTGIEHLRIKESDRIASMQNELGKIGAQIVKKGNGYELIPGKRTGEPLVFDTYGDHRIAMCLAPLALLYDEVKIEDPDVVVKSYPNYWNDLESTGCFKLVKEK
ncbi:MAG: 3-phosphoshikimate 1-carboxyvinyltransferase [Bacteroidales bacterium]|nr:3-phosphoshikimate 1-carboxyvinyltransferase [Bacteroidales bacterium]